MARGKSKRGKYGLRENVIFTRQPKKPVGMGGIDISGDRQIGVEAGVPRYSGKRYAFIDDMIINGLMRTAPILDENDVKIAEGSNRYVVRCWGRTYKTAKRLARNSQLRRGKDRAPESWVDIARYLSRATRSIDDETQLQARLQQLEAEYLRR
jgi:hypothetical protein